MNNHHPFSFSHLPKIKKKFGTEPIRNSSTKKLLSQLLIDSHKNRSQEAGLSLDFASRSLAEGCLDKSDIDSAFKKQDQSAYLESGGYSPANNSYRKKVEPFKKTSDYLKQFQSMENVRFKPDFVKKKITEESRPQFELSDCEILVNDKQERKTMESLKRENAMLREKVAYYKTSK